MVKSPPYFLGILSQFLTNSYTRVFAQILMWVFKIFNVMGEVPLGKTLPIVRGGEVKVNARGE